VGTVGVTGKRLEMVEPHQKVALLLREKPDRRGKGRDGPLSAAKRGVCCRGKNHARTRGKRPLAGNVRNIQGLSVYVSQSGVRGAIHVGRGERNFKPGDVSSAAISRTWISG